jgi:hypothetical protein
VEEVKISKIPFNPLLSTRILRFPNKPNESPDRSFLGCQSSKQNHSPLVYLGSRGGVMVDRLHGEGRHGWMMERRMGVDLGQSLIGLTLVEGEKTRRLEE